MDGNDSRSTKDDSKDGMKMVLTWKKLKEVDVDVNEHTPETGCQTRQRRRENLMNALTKEKTAGSAMGYLSMAAAVFGLTMAATGAQAQGTPKYVVSSHSTLTTTVPAPGETGKPGAPTFTDTNGIGPTMGVNSHGDLFVQVNDYDNGNTITYDFPANGGPGVPFFTTNVGYGGAGVAVGPNDNVYLASESGYGGADSGMYEFPYTNGSYPGAYVYAYASPPGPCFGAAAATSTAPAHAADTGVCALGSYVGAAYYYWQPYEIAVDYSGATYMSSNYDNTLGSNRTGIFYCDVLCNEQAVGANALVLVTEDSAPNTPGHRNAIKAMVGNPIAPANGGAPGDIYWVDGENTTNKDSNGNYLPSGTSVFYLVGAAAQGAAGTQNISTLDSSYISPSGISFDRAGNLYVSDTNGVWETPLVNGQLVVASKFLVLPLTANLVGSAVADTRGDLYYSPYNDDLEQGQLFAGTFPAAAVGTASAAKPFTITFNSAVTLGAITVLQGGATATEFTVSPGTCVAGTAFAAYSSCTFSSTFTPSGVGARSGSIVVADSTGATTVTYLKGVGMGAAVTVDPGTPTLIGAAGLTAPTGVAVDASGNTFVADKTGNAVYEYPAGGGAAVSIGSSLSSPTGVAVDPAGNVFIVNQGPAGASTPSGTVVEVPNVGGVLTTASQSTVFTGLTGPTDIVIDSNGNFFISNTGNNEVLQYPSLNRYGSITTAVSLGLGLSAPQGIALDTSSNVFVADTGNDRVEELGDGYQTTVGSGFSGPTGVAVDASGSVIVADQKSGRVLRVPYEIGFGLNANDQVLMDTPLINPTSIRLDGTGNAYASDSILAEVYQLQRTSGLIDFLSYNLNTSSGPSTIVLSSAGTAPTMTIPDLTLGNPLYAPLPAGSEFVVSSAAAATAASSLGLGTLCPTKPVAPATTIILPSGSNCILSAVFTPTALGPVNYPLVLAAPATNTGTPTVLLTGTGVNLDAATSTISIDTNTIQPLSYNVSFTIDFTVVPSGDTCSATGTVVFAFDGQNQKPTSFPAAVSPCATGPSKATFTFSSVNAGEHTVQAHYEGDVNYASVESPVLNLTIDQATATNVLTITGDSSNPLSAAPTDNVSLTAVLTPSIAGSFTGTVKFLANGVSLSPMPITVSQDPTTKIYSAYLSLKTIPLGFYNIVAVYSGNANYAGDTSNAVSLVISNPTFTVTPANTTASATATSPGIYNLVVTSYSNFQGGVDFKCTGLPANAYCIFRPGLADLLDAPYATIVNVPSVPVVMRIEVSQNPQTVAGSQPSSLGWIGAVLAAVLLFYARRKRSLRGLLATSLMVLLSFGGIVMLNGCTQSTFTSPMYATPAGTYQVTVVATGTPLIGGTLQPATANVTSTFQVAITVK
jgi:sugar lactone lactonase YvrE